LPYYIALSSQFLAALYALLAIRETLPQEKSNDVLSDTASETGTVPLVMRAVGKVAVPVKPLAVIMPYRDEQGVLRWELLALSISLFATTCGVSRSQLASGMKLMCGADGVRADGGAVLPLR
jgi:hypothetical protein